MQCCVTFASAAALLIALSAGSVAGGPPRPNATTVTPVQNVEGKGPERVPVGDTLTPPPAVSGEVPADLIARVRADLAKRTGEAEESFHIVSAQSVVWPNGSLGCPQPGRMYTQALVPGYRVQIESGGKTFVYHASTKGGFKLCKNPSPSLSRPSTE